MHRDGAYAEYVAVNEFLDDRSEAFTDGIGFDTTGHHTGVEMAVDHVRKGGKVVVVGPSARPARCS